MTNQYGRLCDRRTKADDRQVRHVVVSGVNARRRTSSSGKPCWMIAGLDLDRDRFGKDFAGNVEEQPHVVRV